MSEINFYQKNLQRFRNLLKKKDTIDMPTFLKLTRLQYDKDKYVYFLKHPEENIKEPLFTITMEAVADAEHRHDLKNLMHCIIDQMEWENPWFYNLGLHIDEIRDRERYKNYA